MAVEAISERLIAGSRSREALRAAVLEANHRIHAAAADNPEQRGMGTTAVVLSLDGNTALAATVGDSRLYHMNGGGIRQVNRDHTLFEEQRKAGLNPDRQRTGHILTKCVGYNPKVEVDTFRFKVSSGDVLLMCSDGLSDVTEDQTIREVCEQQVDPCSAAKELVDIANRHGGPDNISVVIVRIDAAPRSVWQRLLNPSQ
jgi:protein phosphatase